MRKEPSYISCLNLPGRIVQEITDQAKDVTLGTVRRHLGVHFNRLASQLGYAVANEKGLHIKDDDYVTYHQSHYRGRRIYYIRHSAIEHFFFV